MHQVTRLLIVVGLTLLAAAPLAPAQVLLRSGGLGRCLGVEGGVARPGTRLVGYACDGTARSEVFYFRPDGTIRAFSPIGNLCVDASSGRDGDEVLIWTCHGGPNQLWLWRNGLIAGINDKCIEMKSPYYWLNAWGNQPAVLNSCGRSVPLWSQLDSRTVPAPTPPPPPSQQTTQSQTQQPVATAPAQPVPNNIAGLVGGGKTTSSAGLIGTPGAGLVGNSGGTLTSSQPGPVALIGNNGAAFVGNTGAALKALSATRITQVTPLAELANVTPLRTFSTQAIGDPATRVQQGFQTSLGRAPSPDEQSAWVSWINTHPQFPATRSWQGIVEMFRAALAHPAVGRNLRAAIIQQAFAAIAGRAPSQQELAAWDQKVQGKHYTYADVARELPSTATPNARPAPRATAH